MKKIVLSFALPALILGFGFQAWAGNPTFNPDHPSQGDENRRGGLTNDRPFGDGGPNPPGLGRDNVSNVSKNSLNTTRISNNGAGDGGEPTEDQARDGQEGPADEGGIGDGDGDFSPGATWNK
jgi:hypothetical protein